MLGMCGVDAVFDFQPTWVFPGMGTACPGWRYHGKLQAGASAPTPLS